jgi:hypothetical protein
MIVPMTIPATRSQRCQISMRDLFDGKADDPQRGREEIGAESAQKRHESSDTLIAGGGWNLSPHPGWGCGVVAA